MTTDKARIAIRLVIPLTVLLCIGFCLCGQKVNLVVPLGHPNFISASAFSRDGRFLLTASETSAVLWDVATGAELRRFEGHSNRVQSVAFSDDNRFIMSGSEDKTVRLWNRATGAQLYVFPHDAEVTFVSFHPTARIVAAGSKKGTAFLWNLETGMEVRRWSGHTAPIIAGTFSPDGGLLMTIGETDDRSENGTAIVWDTQIGTEVRRFAGNKEGFLAGAFSPDGKMIVTTCTSTVPGVNDGPLARAWSVKTGAEIRQFPQSSDLQAASHASFSSDGRWVIFSGLKWGVPPQMFGGSSMESREVGSGALRVLYREGGIPRAMSLNGRYLLLDENDLTGVMFLWDTEGKVGRKLGGRAAEEVSSVAVSSDKALVVGSGSVKQFLFPKSEPDNSLRNWDFLTGKPTRLVGHTEMVNALAISPDRQTLASGGADDSVRLWDLATGSEFYRHRSNGWARAISYSPRGDTLAVADQSGLVQLLVDLGQSRNKTLLSSFQASKRPLAALLFSPDGTSVATGDVSGNLILWGLTGRRLATFLHPGGGINSVAFSIDGS